MLMLMTSMAGQPVYVGVMVMAISLFSFTSTFRTIPRSRIDNTGTSGSYTSLSSFRMDYSCMESVVVITTWLPDKLFVKIAFQRGCSPGVLYVFQLARQFASMLLRVFLHRP